MVGRSSRTIYIGNVPLDVTDWEIEDLFYKYGCILDIESKLPPPPPGYRFIEFEDAWAAEDAIRGRDGYNFDGCCLRVELSHGGRGSSSSFDRRVDTVVEVEAALVSLVALSIEVHFFLGLLTSHFILSNLVVVVRGLPASASWQDLKDHMRKGGEDVCFAEVFRDGDGAMGIVDYTNYEDMKYTIRKLDDSEFRNPFRRSYIRLKLYDGSPYGRRRRSRSLSRSRSRTPRRNRT